MKKLFYAFMISLLLCSVAWADSFPTASYSGGTVTIFGNMNYVIGMKTGLEGATNASYTSSDSSMLEIISTQVWNADRVPLCIFKGKKAGSASINVTTDKKSFSIPVNIIPYECPLKSFMIGSNNVAPLFQKALSRTYTGKRGTQKITYSLATGWQANVYHVDENYQRYTIASGSGVNLDDIYKQKYLTGIYIGLRHPATGNSVDLYLSIADQEGSISVIPDLPQAAKPTEAPTPSPTEAPTPSPTEAPTPSPTEALTPSPTTTPTLEPTATPTQTPVAPSATPTPEPNVTPTPKPKISIENAEVRLYQEEYHYTGEPIIPSKMVIKWGSILKEGVDYTASYTNNVNVGLATMTLTGIGDYTGERVVYFDVIKAINPMTLKGKTVSVKASSGKIKIKQKKAIEVKDAVGELYFYKVSGSKALSISGGGTITVKKGTKKGTYKIKVNVSAGGNKSYDLKSKNVTVKVKVK